LLPVVFAVFVTETSAEPLLEPDVAVSVLLLPTGGSGSATPTAPAADAVILGLVAPTAGVSVSVKVEIEPLGRFQVGMVNFVRPPEVAEVGVPGFVPLGVVLTHVQVYPPVNLDAV